MTYFFIGVAGAGMSALARFLAMKGHKVLGSDRLFNLYPDHPIAKQLVKSGIQIFPQGEAQIPADATVIVSTAIEDSVPELKQARERGLPLLHRSGLLHQISQEYKSIAVAGTAGKSTTAAMIFHILSEAGLKPSLINGAPLLSLQSQGYIANAWADSGQWLVFEADESDGTIVTYKPHIGLLLNISLDHGSPALFLNIFARFALNCQIFITNLSDDNASLLRLEHGFDFCWEGECDYAGEHCRLSWQGTQFLFNKKYRVELSQLGCHNAQNAVAAIAAAAAVGIDPADSVRFLRTFKGIHRRMQIIYRGINYTVIDDYAHNPAKIAAAIRTVQQLAPQVIAWFQPHGFSPLRLFGDELVRELSSLLRPYDVFVMSKVYYVGGTVERDVCAADYVERLRQLGVNALFLENRKALPDVIKKYSIRPSAILLMGARDPLLADFANYVSNYVIYFDD